MDDLIERLRRAKLRHESGYMKDVGFLLAEAADALEAAQRSVVIATGERNRVQAKWDKCRINLRAAREDRARLDWLDTQRGDDVQGSYPEEPQLVGHYWSIDGQCTDVRTAIDAAREARNG